MVSIDRDAKWIDHAFTDQIPHPAEHFKCLYYIPSQPSFLEYIKFVDGLILRLEGVDCSIASCRFCPGKPNLVEMSLPGWHKQQKSVTSGYRRTEVNLETQPGQLPDRTIHNFRTSRSGDRQIFRSQGMSRNELWSSKIEKGSVREGPYLLWKRSQCFFSLGHFFF